jgi:hypothetical protein
VTVTDLPTHNVRAGDADREAVGEALRRHHADGRLDVDELQERINRCYSAQTQGELQLLLADLPAPPPRHDAFGWRGPRHWWPVAVAFFVLLAVTSGGRSGHWHHPIWPVLLLAFLAFRLMRGRYSPTARSRP